MSETKLATKADLKEMYDRMLPYMGGMPEMLANKFSKGDLYSTDEKMIGQWIDGKPLYQKTIQTILPTDGSAKSIPWSSISENIEKVVELKGVSQWIDNDGKSVIPYIYLNISKSSDTADYVSVYTNSNGLQLVTKFANSRGKTSYITIKYTKTTDSAISIGSDTDYSTDEKVVGTWIDGKPIYQKTIEITTGSSSATKSISTGIANISAIISAAGFIQNSTQNIPMNTTWSSNEANVIFNITSSDTTMVVKAGHSDWQNKTAYITLKYTKTT